MPRRPSPVLPGEAGLHLDLARESRQGFPEVVFCEGKSDAQVIAAMKGLAAAHGRALGTRLAPERAAAVLRGLRGAGYDAEARLLRVGKPRPPRGPVVLVVCAGTSDLPVAGEAAGTLGFLGHPVERLVDVGVAGLHRLMGAQDRLAAAAVTIVVAGMEGALPSVVGGLVGGPVIAVPTSVGYGASFGGLAALLGMLNSCASGLTVVNIDNGFGAAVAAHRILRVAAAPGAA
jgi:pyridinium-3,5-biscarboxylic acid mononucleotide synthase